MLIQVMERTNKVDGAIDYLVDKVASANVGLWSPDVRFAQICDSATYDVWDFGNDDRRRRIDHFTYELVLVETKVYYIISTPRGWVFVTESPGQYELRKTIGYSMTQCSIILGEDYEDVRQLFLDIKSFEHHVKTRQFPFGS